MMKERNRIADYEYLIQEFGEEVLENRFLLIKHAAERSLKDWDIIRYVNISHRAIKNAVIDYFADISRLKNFHEIEKTNFIKVASYTAYWIYKRHPLSVVTDPSIEELKAKPFLHDINEWFCTHLMISMIYDSRKPLIKNHEPSEALKKWREFKLTLNYLFVYRIVTLHSLELSLIALDANPPYEHLKKIQN